MNVYDYYRSKFGTCPHERSLRELDIHTPCGKDCKAAIDAAFSFLKHAGDASPHIRSAVYDQVIDATNEIIETYWVG